MIGVCYSLNLDVPPITVFSMNTYMVMNFSRITYVTIMGGGQGQNYYVQFMHYNII